MRKTGVIEGQNLGLRRLRRYGCSGTGLYMKSPMEVMAAHCLETIDPDFVPNVRPGDIICAGKNFGWSSREQTAQSLVFHGVAPYWHLRSAAFLSQCDKPWVNGAGMRERLA